MFAAPEELEFRSRRSPIVCLNGCVATSQPLASELGLRVLRAGGNAADAAVAACAALNVTEPCQCGIGGDAFCVYYDAKTKTVRGLNGSGRSPAALTLAIAEARGGPRGGAAVGGMLDEASAHCVTVPGAAACWADAVAKFGKKPLADVLAPAIELAEAGAPIHGVAASLWRENAHQLTDRWGGLEGNPGAAALLVDGRPPRRGEVLRNPELARTFRALAAEGRDGFYRGRVAEALVAAVRGKGGLLALEDLAAHKTEVCEPVSTNYRRKTVWELPPNGCGAVALLALDILEGFGPGTPDEDAHRTIEALRLAFSDGLANIGDGADGAVAKLLDPERVAGHRALLREGRALGGANGPHAAAALDALGTDTVFLTAVDGDGNACAFICSNYCSFGSGLAPLGCGFTLHNRGYNFVLENGHANCLAPRKRPYHTIIPAVVTDEDGDFFASFGVMGGFMQPQGHVQVLRNVLDFGMDPQAALDAPRLCLSPAPGGNLQRRGALRDVVVHLEAGFDDGVADALEARGHVVVRGVSSYARKLFGRGQLIVAAKPRRGERGDTVLWAGSDPRGDGCALGY